jgi:hypothetical protein
MLTDWENLYWVSHPVQMIFLRLVSAERAAVGESRAPSSEQAGVALRMRDFEK